MMWRRKSRSLRQNRLYATLKTVPAKQFRVHRTEICSFEMHAPHEKSSFTTLKPLTGGLLALPS